jgi:competence protein ComEC
MPLVAWHFGRVNPWAIVASFALAAPVFASLIGGLMKIVLTFAFPSAAGTWATLAAGPIWCMRRMLAALDTLPGSSVPLAPPWQLLMACYVLLLAAIFIRTRSGLRWALVTLAVGSYAALLVLPVQRAVAQHLSTGDELRITLLSVGAGQCAVIEPPGGRTTLIDAGSTSLTDLWRKCLGPFLHAEGQTVLDTIIVSHGDVDHISAVSEAVSIYDVREVLTGPLFAANAGGNPAALQMLATLDDLNRPPRIVTPGDVIPLGKNTRIEILWPPPGQSLPDNDSGVVLKLTHNDCSILFPADIQDIAMGELLKNPARIKADILIAPHHGSSETLTQQFVNAVNPKAILSSNDRTLSYKQRRFETLIGSRPLYRTNECGAITITIDAKGAYKIEPFLKSMK